MGEHGWQIDVPSGPHVHGDLKDYSVPSPFVQAELGLAARLKLKIIPIKVEFFD